MIDQFGVIPWRRGAAGAIEILLITSRETRRWVVPRGNAIAGLRDHEAAAQEAFEEAGIRGGVEERPLGSYRYDKRRRDGSLVEAEVQLFRMLVTEEASKWPERDERERQWFSLPEAAAAVAEPDLSQLILQIALD